jgi:predicted DsbA family dithiol-disulfide isomerase
LGENEAKEAFVDYANSIGLDPGEFTKIMNSDEAENAVLAGEKEALTLGLNSTPTFFIGTKKVAPAGYDEFKQIIDGELNQQKPLK